MSLDRLAVLVIDDERLVRDAAAMCLERMGCTVRAAADAQTGAMQAREFKPDVILCDAQMPILSGPALIRQLKAEPETAAVPVVLMSGLGNADDFPDVPLAGFLQKPFGANELRRAVTRAAAQAKERE